MHNKEVMCSYNEEGIKTPEDQDSRRNLDCQKIFSGLGRFVGIIIQQMIEDV